MQTVFEELKKNKRQSKYQMIIRTHATMIFWQFGRATRFFDKVWKTAEHLMVITNNDWLCNSTYKIVD